MSKPIKKKSKLQQSKSTKIVFSIVYILFCLYAFYILYLLLFALNTSFKESGRVFINDSLSLSFNPFKGVFPKFSNYLTAFKELEHNENSYLMMTFNSIWYAGLATIFGTLSSAMAAYVVCKYKFIGRNFLYSLVIFIMIIPIYGALPARYKLFADLSFIDSPTIILSMLGGFDFAFLIIYSYFKNISWNFAEAAFIDGAGHGKVFFNIMLPMAMPAITVMVITNFIGLWNNYENPILFLPNLPTLASGLWAYEDKIKYTANQPVYFAGVIISLIPVLTIFGVFQNTIMQSVYAGGLKG